MFSSLKVFKEVSSVGGMSLVWKTPILVLLYLQIFWCNYKYSVTYLESSSVDAILLIITMEIFPEKLRALWHLYFMNYTNL